MKHLKKKLAVYWIRHQEKMRKLRVKNQFKWLKQEILLQRNLHQAHLPVHQLMEDQEGLSAATILQEYKEHSQESRWEVQSLSL